MLYLNQALTFQILFNLKELKSCAWHVMHSKTNNLH